MQIEEVLLLTLTPGVVMPLGASSGLICVMRVSLWSHVSGKVPQVLHILEIIDIAQIS